jgi:hypothetical protein
MSLSWLVTLDNWDTYGSRSIILWWDTLWFILKSTFRLLIYIYIYLKNEKDLDIDLDLHKNIKKINNFKMILDLLIIPLGPLPLLKIKIEDSYYNHTEM